MARPSCRPCAEFLSRCARPLPSSTATATRHAPLRSLHQAAQALTALSASTTPAREATRPRPRRTGPGSASRRLHTTPPSAGIAEKLGDMARGAVRRTVEPYGAFGVTRQMYQKCSRQAAYEISEEARRDDVVPTTEDGEEIGVGGGIWHKDFGLLPSFSTWSQVTMLHMYLVVTRLRCFDKETYQLWQSMLADHFFQEAEDKMDRVHHITARSLRQRHLQDLFMAWRGVMVAYDEGLMSSDAVLAAALWRNLFKARADVDLRALAAAVAWMRRSYAAFDRMPDESLVLHGGSGIFTWPDAAALLPAVDEPATKELAALLLQARRAAGGAEPEKPETRASAPAETKAAERAEKQAAAA